MCTGSNDHILSTVFIFFTFQNFYIAFQFYLFDHIRYSFGPEFFGLLRHPCDQGRSWLPFYDLSRIIFDVICDCDLSAIFTFLNNQCWKTDSSCVQSRCQTSRTCTKDDNVINLTHFTLYLLYFYMYYSKMVCPSTSVVKAFNAFSFLLPYPVPDYQVDVELQLPVRFCLHQLS